MGSETVKASIIIASNNRRPIARRATHNALVQDFPPDEFEVILVLDGCEEPDWCAAERRGARCRFVATRQPKRGQAASINAGLRLAGGELALFLDDDILCPPDLLAKHVEAHRSHPGHLAFGPIFTSEESSAGLATEWIRNLKDGWFQQIKPGTDTGQGWCFCFANPNTSAPRKLLLEAGALDESFWRYNDTEFGFRLWKQGLRFVYLPDAAVTHVVAESLDDLVQDHAFEEGRAEVRLCRKHPEYRRFTLLGGISQGPAFKVLRRRMLVAACGPIDFILAPLSHIADALRRIPLMRRAGLWFISLRFTAHFFRGAIAECGSWKQFRREFAQRLAVLNYHRVGQPQPGEWYALTIPPHRLENHLRWLKRDGWKSITSAQWLAWLETGNSLPEKPILLTFDDGYADNLANAFPLLQRYGFVALTAAVTGQLGATNRWDTANGLPEHPLMDADDIRRWSMAGMEFGSHSRTHAHLVTLPDDALAGELAGSRSELNALTGKETNSLVYPYGEYDDRVCSQAASHYSLAFSLESGLNALGDSPLRLRRIVISQKHTPLHLWLYTRLGSNPLRAILQALRGRGAQPR